MPSALGHLAAGAAAGYSYPGSRGFLYWSCILGLALLPDLDVLAFTLGIPYAHPLGHRGFSHSLIFAVLASFILYRFLISLQTMPERRRLFLALFLSALTHPLLDALTSGGLGVALFSPFSNQRYFLPWRPIQVSPLGIEAFFGEWGRRVIFSEARWIYLPALLLIGILFLARRIRKVLSHEKKKGKHHL